MKVLHVVTLHTPTHDFGGPTRVALNLSQGLRRRGVDARIAALADGFDGPLPSSVESVPTWLFQARHPLPRFEVSGITSPALLARARRLVSGADIVHVHLMRDLVALPTALLALRCGRPVVLQTHGMVDPSEHRLARLVDLLGMRRVLRRADALLYLTETERREVAAVAGPGRLTTARRLVNGVPLQDPRPSSEPGRPPTVLYLARVQERKRPADFVSAMPTVLRHRPDARFLLAGPDTGALAGRMLALAERLGVADSLEYLGPLDHPAVLERMRRSDVYVLPSLVEPFAVSVLEAMSVGLPVVVTGTGGLSPDVEAAGAGRVVDSRPDSDNGPLLGRAILELLDPAENARASDAARRLVREQFSLEQVVETAHGVYREVLERRR
ncbi:glycosyltransferase [Streptomyces sp. TP-A0874]|uniref:glycosyltransferase n=1 Tax=Streptomyces sp. TP-A0874 TaxID=549819 RepID=UPI00085302CA|nr:glycosyltransferase [Streptomyces sp. TP-A0874]